MKRIICITLIFALSISAAFASGSGDNGSRNKITIYTSMYQEVIDAVQEQLRNDFPRYHIEFVYGGSGRLEHKVATEKAAGRLGCDILMTAEPSYSLELKKMGLLHSYLSKEAFNLAFEYDREGYWYPVRILNMVLAYNPDRTPKNTIPNSFYDFAHDTRVRGALSMRNPNISGTTMAALTALRDKYGYEYFDALGRQNVQIDYGSAGVIQKLQSGEYKVAMILEESILQSRQHGSKLEVIYPTDGTVMIPSTIMIVNKKWSANKNIKIAEQITDWFLSEKGQDAIVAGWMHSVRTDFNKIPYDSIPTSEIRGKSIAVNWEYDSNQREQILNRIEDRR